MTDLIALAFDDSAAADDVLRRLRAKGATHLLDLEEACVAERDECGELHLKQAISDRITDRLPHRFWRHLIAHILHQGQEHMPEEGLTPELGLDRRFVREVTRALNPGSSALFVAVKRARLQDLLDALREHDGRVLTASLPPRERDALAAALAPPPPRVPPAVDLLDLAARERREETEQRRHQRKAAAEERRHRIERLRTERLTDHDLADLVRQFCAAARRGQTSVLAYRFPSELCTDGGRAINNDLPEWPDTLVGPPREIYDYWHDHLRPTGYHLRAEVLDYPDGVPGDVGLTFSWSTPA